ncbi:MAG: hypothetical protein WAP47_08860, partial [Candidatus Rokuibacteriota bacterium]
MVVGVGPFQRIVGFNWPASVYGVVEFYLSFWGESQGLIKCYDFTGPSFGGDAFYSPSFWVNNIQLRPQKGRYAAGYTTGITTIFGEDPEPSAYSVSGIPSFELFPA